MEAATGDWTQFRYTVEAWLLPYPDDPKQLLKFQPVSLDPNEDWTDQLGTAIDWLLSGRSRRIAE